MIHSSRIILYCRYVVFALLVSICACGDPDPNSLKQIESDLRKLQDNYRVLEGDAFRQQGEILLVSLDRHGDIEEVRFQKSFVLNMIAGSLKQDDRHADSIPFALQGLKLIRSVPPRENSRQTSDALFALELAFLQNLTWSYEYGDDREQAAMYRSELVELLYEELTKSHQRCGMAFKMLVDATIEQNRYLLEQGRDEAADVFSRRLAAFNGCDGHVQR